MVQFEISGQYLSALQFQTEPLRKIEITFGDYEVGVKNVIFAKGHHLEDFQVTRKEVLKGSDGEYIVKPSEFRGKVALNHRIAFTGLACGLLAAGVAIAAAKPNFTGTWALEHSRSHSVPRDMQQTMTVTHEGDKINVETKIVTPQGERVVKDEYVLDGKETGFIPQPGPAEVVGKGKRTAKWLPGDKGFTVAEEFQTKSPEGAVVNNLLTRKWIIWADGSLSIDLYQDGPRGSFESKRVFTKKQ